MNMIGITEAEAAEILDGLEQAKTALGDLAAFAITRNGWVACLIAGLCRKVGDVRTELEEHITA